MADNTKIEWTDTQSPDEPVAWWWEDKTGCFHITLDRPDVQLMAETVGCVPSPLYARPAVGPTIAALQRVHVERQEEWCPDQKPDLSFRGNELGGECGEAQNVIKKLERERHGWRGSRDTVEHLAEELADVIHCTILCAITAGIDLEPAVVEKFNSASRKNGLRTMIAAGEQALAAREIGCWHWWAGDNDELFTVGPEDSRDAIIQAATNDRIGEFEGEDGIWRLGFHIVEARSDPLRLADWIESDRLLERAEDRVADSDRISLEHEEGPWFDCTPQQEEDLKQRVMRACDQWQVAHGLTFTCRTFSHTRNNEHVVVDVNRECDP